MNFYFFIFHFIELSTIVGNCSDGEVRLEGGNNSSLGRVEVCVNNVWGSVCNSRFGRSEAIVICRQLGFNDTGKITEVLLNVYLTLPFSICRSSSFAIHNKLVWRVFWSDIPGKFRLLWERATFV